METPRCSCLKLTLDEDGARRVQEFALDLGALAVTLLENPSGDAPGQSIFHDPAGNDSPLWASCLVEILLPEGVDPEHFITRLQDLCLLRERPPFTCRPSTDKNWVLENQKDWRPVRIRPGFWIIPTGESVPEKDAAVVRLDPGMGFGTGSHPTTRLCLEWLFDHLRERESVIDYGCGSGILGIAALKLGASRALAWDVDPQALSAARANARTNGVSLEFTPESPAPHHSADIVIANILPQTLMDLREVLTALTRPSGWLVLSGFYQGQAEAIQAAYGAGFAWTAPATLEQWGLLAGKRRPA